MKQTLQRLAIWLFVAFLFCLPTSLSFSSRLLGDPQIDVWNHAWGYWFVFQALSEGTLPFETSLIGAPGGVPSIILIRQSTALYLAQPYSDQRLDTIFYCYFAWHYQPLLPSF